MDKCVLCKKEVKMTFINKLRDDDTRFAYRCSSCTHVQVVPLPTIQEDEIFYKTDEMQRGFISKDEMTDEELELKYRSVGIRQAEKINYILCLSKNEKILEIGSGYGSFVENMQGRGYDVNGIELNEEKCRMLRKRTGIEMMSYNILVECDEMKQDENKYDVVCMHHVFEHISGPDIFLTRVKRLLKDRGIIYMEVPNFSYFLKDKCKPFNDFSYTRKHLSYFTPETLKYALSNNGFVDIKIYGNQQFGIENAFNWIRKGVPVKSEIQLDSPEELGFADEYYKKHLEEQLLSDAIIAVGRKGD